MTVISRGLMGCPSGAGDCNQAPPMDGYITFWTPIFVVAIFLMVSLVSWWVWRSRSRRTTSI